VASRRDPVVVEHTLVTAALGASADLRMVWTDRGGHVSFPADLDLGLGAGVGVEQQVVAWLGRQ
jgi:hypothetical protein